MMSRAFLTLAVLAAVAFSERGRLLSSAATGALPVNVGDRKQLLFDDVLVASKTGFVTTMNRAIPHGSPVVIPDRPWEERRIGLGQSVLEDEGVFKMWYTAWASDREWRLCYATSRDRIRWEKPDLGLIEYEGSTKNNIVFVGAEKTKYAASGTVFKDAHDSQQRRFKLVYSSTPRRDEDMAGLRDVATYDYSDARWNRTRHFISAALSPDGVRWSGSSRLRMIDWYTDTHDVAFWDERIQKYVLFVRWNHERWNRSIGRSESDDFENFPAPSLILTPDSLDPLVTGLYNSAKYAYAENAYFLFPSAFFHAERGVGGGIDGSEVQLAISRDGVNFQRPWRQAFIGVGHEGRFDASQVYVGAGLLRVEDEIWLYYTGYQPSHKQLEAPPPRIGGIGIARIRLDGFVSQDAPPTSGEHSPGGVLTTVPLMFSGGQLEVNINAGAGGWLKVEILDEQGKEIPEFSSANSNLTLGNSVRRRIAWRANSDLSTLRRKIVRLRFVGRDVKLYAFQFTN